MYKFKLVRSATANSLVEIKSTTQIANAETQQSADTVID